MDDIDVDEPVGCLALYWRHASVNVSCMSAFPHRSLRPVVTPSCERKDHTMTFPRRRPARSMHRWSQGGPNKTQQLALMTARSQHQPPGPDDVRILGRRRRWQIALAHIDTTTTQTTRELPPLLTRSCQHTRAIYLHAHTQPPIPSTLLLCSPIPSTTLSPCASLVLFWYSGKPSIESTCHPWRTATAACISRPAPRCR